MSAFISLLYLDSAGHNFFGEVGYQKGSSEISISLSCNRSKKVAMDWFGSLRYHKDVD